MILILIEARRERLATASRGSARERPSDCEGWQLQDTGGLFIIAIIIITIVITYMYC